MAYIKAGDLVKLCYRGRLQELTSFAVDEECRHVEVRIGSGDILKGFEDAILGMKPHERKTFTLDPTDAYGNRDESLIRVFNRSELPSNFDAKPGEVIALHSDRGGELVAIVKDTDTDQVTLDMNHPLAGKSITFEVEIEGIQAA